MLAVQPTGTIKQSSYYTFTVTGSVAGCDGATAGMPNAEQA